MSEQTTNRQIVVDRHHVPRARSARAARRRHVVPLTADVRDFGRSGRWAPRRP